MAKKTITLLTDDLDGSTADRTVEFSLDGVNYTIDLSDSNAGKLRKALEPYLGAGTRLGRTAAINRRSPVASSSSGGGSTRDRNQAIREWAAKNGHQLAERGRIPSGVVEAFDAAH
ncbi:MULTISPECIES: Lsr2 family protein [Actinoplanes]|uniref:histone-like nucleoid-structuring protein Lsr2 n=1 Tax=Actinoplanes TaxID=1865 RepID=UPI0005F2A9DC|nr:MULTISPECIES: Lsr2 family protein [Actinoplanes]GLY08478.1 Lsr2 family protein [Actinoplanes sp. NBRC 101535]